jgi:hypothetical protein
MSKDRAGARARGGLALAGAAALALLCCGGLPLALAALAGVGLGGPLGGLGGALAAAAIVVGALALRRARRRRIGNAGPRVDDCCAPPARDEPAPPRAEARR